MKKRLFIHLPVLTAFISQAIALAAQGTIQIHQAEEGNDSVIFTFSSTWPKGTSHQPQFLREPGGAWMDVPDARVEAVEGADGMFRVIAPRFGGASGFYRVLNAASRPDDPVPNTLGESGS